MARTDTSYWPIAICSDSIFLAPPIRIGRIECLSSNKKSETMRFQRGRPHRTGIFLYQNDVGAPLIKSFRRGSCRGRCEHLTRLQRHAPAPRRTQRVWSCIPRLRVSPPLPLAACWPFQPQEPDALWPLHPPPRVACSANRSTLPLPLCTADARELQPDAIPARPIALAVGFTRERTRQPGEQDEGGETALPLIRAGFLPPLTSRKDGSPPRTKAATSRRSSRTGRGTSRRRP